MKIFEIIDTQFKTIDIPDKFDKEAMQKAKDIEIEKPHSTAGAYAKVTLDDPLNAKKEYHLPIEEDAYLDFIKMISEKGLSGSNPYFPRVWNVTTKKDPNGELLPSFDMEPLYEPSEFDLKALMSMGRRMFNDFDKLLPVRDSSALQVRFAIAHIMSRVIKNNAFDKVKDPKLKEALLAIKDLVDKSNGEYRIDLHAKNYMVRPTSIGPQLVLTDPVANKVKNADPDDFSL